VFPNRGGWTNRPYRADNQLVWGVVFRCDFVFGNFRGVPRMTSRAFATTRRAKTHDIRGWGASMNDEASGYRWIAFTPET
jgi:hypothetical protein